jgi:hypothetical protein
MNTEKTWAEFKKAGMLWWVNRVLHLLGWVLILEEDENGEVRRVYPAHTKFRGFSEETEDEGFRAVTADLAARSEELLAAVSED